MHIDELGLDKVIKSWKTAVLSEVRTWAESYAGAWGQFSLLSTLVVLDLELD